MTEMHQIQITASDRTVLEELANELVDKRGALIMTKDSMLRVTDVLRRVARTHDNLALKGANADIAAMRKQVAKCEATINAISSILETHNVY